MIDISEIQCSVNRAVSSVFGLRGVENELDSLNSLCSALESLNLNNNDSSLHKTAINYDKYDCNGNYYQFLENLRTLLLLFAKKLVNLNSLTPELSHLYIKIFLSITETFKNNNIAFETDPLCFCIFKIWCNVLCLNNSNKIDQDSFKKNEKIFKHFLPLVLNVYRCKIGDDEWSKLLYIILETFKNTQDDQLLDQIFEALECCENRPNVFEVYPGVVSALINKLRDLNTVQVYKCVKTLVSWFKLFLDAKNESYLAETSHLKTLLAADKNKDELLNNTTESIKYVVKRFRNSNSKAVTLICLRCVDYDFLENDLRYMMCRCVLESVLKGDQLDQTSNELRCLSVSSKLIFRDLVSEAITETGDKAVDTFKAYLSIRDCFECQIDEYLAIKFLINNVQMDFSGMDKKLTFNRKYLLDAAASSFADVVEKYEKSENFCTKYFQSMSKQKKLDVFSNLMSLFESSETIAVNVRLLHLLNELALCDSPDDSFLSDELITDLKSAIVSNDMFAMAKRTDNVLVSNLSKVKLIELLTLVIRNDSYGTLAHRDMETVLFNILPELNSDYIRISQSSSDLMNELSLYFNRFVRKDQTIKQNEHLDQQLQLRGEGNEMAMFSELLEYYTNSLSKKIIYSIDSPGVADVIYSLTSFNNRAVDIKLIFDLTVQFCKYYDEFAGMDDLSSPEYSLDQRMLNVFYSFNYMLIFMKRYLIEPNNYQNMNGIEDITGKNGQYLDELEDEDGKGDFELSIGTLIITRVRYHLTHKNANVKYLAVLALYRTLVVCAKNEYIFRIRVHEVWDCLEHSLENSRSQTRMVITLLEIFKLVAVNSYEFVEKRLVRIFELVEKMVLEDEQLVGVADEANGTMRYKWYLAITEFAEQLSKHVLNRVLFSKLMLVCIKIHSPKTSETIKQKVNQILRNLSRKDPTLVRNVILEINKGESMNTVFIKFALKRDLKKMFPKPPPQLAMELPTLS